MADLPSSFWGGWIAVITIVSLLGLVWLLFSVYFSKSGTADHDKIIWDETLNEGEHPAPFWWFWLILSILVISIIYLILYPGLGTYSGTMKYSQKGRIDDVYANYLAEFNPIRNTIFALSLEEIREEDSLMESAKGIFDRNCAMCHGNSGLGVTNTFPNLMDGVWQWGASITNIEQTIRNGRRAVMPGWDSSLNSNQIDQLAEFLQSLSSGIIIPDSDPGRLIYSQLCFSCHGTEGKGNINIGAPSLVDTVWLYGKSDDDLTETIRNGRNGTMPGFYNKLDDVQIRLLLAWLSR